MGLFTWHCHPSFKNTFWTSFILSTTGNSHANSNWLVVAAWTTKRCETQGYQWWLFGHRTGRGTWARALPAMHHVIISRLASILKGILTPIISPVQWTYPYIILNKGLSVILERNFRTCIFLQSNSYRKRLFLNLSVWKEGTWKSAALAQRLEMKHKFNSIWKNRRKDSCRLQGVTPMCRENVFPKAG